ncbi:MAG: hypothetical protein SGJ27_06515 [Candidatus Melainabacteria bacterium]|nr:hypothetical protein [Candidatus Melainabacteria bacterium]
MSTSENVFSKQTDSTRHQTEANPGGITWDIDLCKPDDSRTINRGCTRLPTGFQPDSSIELYDSTKEAAPLKDSQRDTRSAQTDTERLKQALVACVLLLQLSPKSFSELMKPIEKAIRNYFEQQNSNGGDGEHDTKDSTNDNTNGHTKNDTTDNTKNNTKDGIKNNTRDGTKSESKDDTKNNTKDDTNNEPGDKSKEYAERVVHVKDGHQLETLKIEKGMTVKLEPGVHYKIQKGLQLPEGASIVGDKNNPPSIDYVGSTVYENGRNSWPTCITINGANATVDGVKLEASNMQMFKTGGANGIFANENADNLTVKNCTAGKINSFVQLNGADNATVDNCNVKAVNSYFLWNEKGSTNTTIKNSRCDDSYLEWTVRSYGDNLKVEDSRIGNINKPQGPFKGALALYNGSATVEDCIVDGGMRIGPLNESIHGLQYIDPKHKDQLRPDLTADEIKKAETLNDFINVRATGNKITGWVSLNQNSNSYFENNDINRPTAANGSWVAFTETKGEYSGFRDPAEGVFDNNRFGGPVQKALYNPWNTPVRLGKGNTMNGRPVS